jgi:hypothetical protein
MRGNKMKIWRKSGPCEGLMEAQTFGE